MLYSRLFVAMSAVALAGTMAVGCTSGKTTQPSAQDNPQLQPFAAALPSPAELLARFTKEREDGRKVSYVPSDLIKAGDEYDTSLPNNNVYLIGDDLALDSWLEPQECTLDDVAYACFHFEAPDYDALPHIRLRWTDEPLQPEYWYVAVANWGANRWDWYTGNADNRIVTPDMDRYMAFGGNLVLAVFCTGPLNGLLNEVHLGGVAPSARLTVNPGRGEVPLEVFLEGRDSQAVEGTITKYEWDFDGDGTYDADTGTTGYASHTYTENGEYHPRLRVTNSELATDTDTDGVEAIGDWTHTWGLENDDMLYDLLQTSDGSIYATGFTTKTTGAQNKALLLLRVSPTGVVVWAKSWDTGSSSEGRRIVTLASGDLVVAGRIYFSSNYDVLVQRWTRTGELVWSKRYGGVSVDEATALLADGDITYIAGNTDSTSASTTDFVLAKLDPNGVHYWGYSRDHGEMDFVTDMCARRDPGGTLHAVFVVGNSYDFADWTPNPWLVEYYDDGILATSLDLGSVDHDVTVNAVTHVPGALPVDERLYFAAEFEDSFSRYSGLLCHNGGGKTIFITRWNVLGDDSLKDVLLYDADTALACGWLAGAERYGTLLRYDRGNGHVDLYEEWDCLPYYAYFQSMCKSPFDGVVLAGAAHTGAGHWQTSSGSVATFDWEWNASAVSLPTTLEWAWDINVSGTVEEIREELRKSEDDAAGEDDLAMAHHML